MSLPPLSRPRPELLPDTASDFPRWQATDDTVNLVTLMDPRTAGTAVREALTANNSWFMIPAPSSVTAYPAVLKKTRTSLMCTPGAVLRSLTVDDGATVQLTGARVLGTVQVAAGGVLIASGCRFDAQVQMANGAIGHFIGCFTRGVNNAGALANAYVIGCHRDGGVNVGVTVIAETT